MGHDKIKFSADGKKARKTGKGVSKSTSVAIPKKGKVGTVDFFSDNSLKTDYMYTDETKISNLLKEGRRVWGYPAAALTWGVGNTVHKNSLVAGIQGEKMTANILRELADEYPQMFVFHSLSWPESYGDTDHIVVWGDNIIIIDSKRWKGGRNYSITKYGEIARGSLNLPEQTVDFPEGKVSTKTAVRYWRQKLPNHRVMGLVCIAQKQVSTTRDLNWIAAPYRLVEIEKLKPLLQQIFKDYPITTPTKDSLLTYLATLLVKPKSKKFVKYE